MPCGDVTAQLTVTAPLTAAATVTVSVALHDWRATAPLYLTSQCSQKQDTLVPQLDLT